MIKTAEAPSTTRPGLGCAVCGAPVMAARNPFYGVDLAVHQYVRNCVECSWYDFASDPNAGSDNWTRTGHEFGGFWSKLNAAFGLVKAA